MSIGPGLSDDLLPRVLAEFLEMPDLRLTPAQAGRLWGVGTKRSSALLTALADAGFLVPSGNRYARRDGTGERCRRPAGTSQ